MAGGPCDACDGPCCLGHAVPLGGGDLLRLQRGLGVSWRALAELETHRFPPFGAFRLDAGGSHHRFVLKRRESGACRLLLELDGIRRCGVHALRPDACRLYPLGDDGQSLGGHVLCPPEPRAAWARALPSLRAVADEDHGELVLWGRVVERWDHLARVTPTATPLDPDAFVAWLATIYAAIDPLRTSERGAWQPEAYRRIDAFPLPV